jgi:FkbM family methyltransferase
VQKANRLSISIPNGDRCDVIRPGAWLHIKQRLPYRLRHVFARIERPFVSRRGVKIWLDDQPTFCAPDTAPAFRAWGPDHIEDQRMMQRVFGSLQPGDRFLDVGSHFGFYAIGAARRVGGNGRVIAFEPTPETVKKLVRNIRLNKLDAAIEIEQVAITDKDGSADFVMTGTSMMNSIFQGKPNGQNRPGGRALQLQVATRSLDDFFDPQGRTVAKIDTEGAEIAVLRGAPKLLSSEAIIFVELHPWAWGQSDGGWEEFEALCKQGGRTVCRLDGASLDAPAHCRVELVRQN